MRCGVGAMVLDVELRRAICPIPTIFGRLFWSYYIRDGCGVTHCGTCIISSRVVEVAPNSTTITIVWHITVKSIVDRLRCRLLYLRVPCSSSIEYHSIILFSNLLATSTVVSSKSYNSALQENDTADQCRRITRILYLSLSR